jgi:hypothetical protein
MKKTRILAPERKEKQKRTQKNRSPRKKKIFDTLNTRTAATPRDAVFFLGETQQKKKKERLYYIALC